MFSISLARVACLALVALSSTCADAYRIKRGNQTQMNVEEGNQTQRNVEETSESPSGSFCQDTWYDDKAKLCLSTATWEVVCRGRCDVCCEEPTPEPTTTQPPPSDEECQNTWYDNKAKVCLQTTTWKVICRGPCNVCCPPPTTPQPAKPPPAAPTCGAAPTIPNAQISSEAVGPVVVGTKLTYWCDDGYVIDGGLCEEHAFEKDMDYWLPDHQNIPATAEYNSGFKWTDKASDGETTYWGNVPDAKGCCDLCRTHEGCNSFAYNADPSWNYEPWSGAGNKACYLKRGLKPNRRAAPGVISGFPVGSFTVTCNATLKFATSATCTQKAAPAPAPPPVELGCGYQWEQCADGIPGVPACCNEGLQCNDGQCNAKPPGHGRTAQWKQCWNDDNCAEGMYCLYINQWWSQCEFPKRT